MLIGNYSVLAKTPGRWIGGGAIGLGMNRGDFNKTSMARGVFNAVDWEPKSGIPDGYRNPYAWVMPQTSGALSARKNLTGAGDAAASIAGGKNAEAALTGAGDMSGTGALIISMVAALAGSGTISNADAVAFLQLAAALAGAGDLAGAATAIGHAAAALSGSGAATSTIRATGSLASSITVSGDLLTSTNVGAAVWAALAAANNDTGTMGEKLNDAGSASNPWTEVIESGYTAAEILRLLAAVAQGDASGLESGAPVFKSIDGATDRVTATYTSGTRTVTGRDAT